MADEANLRRSLFGPRRHAEVLIAETDGQPVGFALFFHNFSTFLGKPGLYLEDLYVTTAARGGGVGRGLLARLARIAVSRECGRVEWSVLDWNEQAVAFYKGMGARPMDGWQIFRVESEALQALAERDDDATK